MRRRSSSIWRRGRFVVPVRATVAVISAKPGARYATDAFPLRKKSCAEILGNVRASARTTCMPLTRVTTMRLGQATGRSGPRAGGEERGACVVTVVEVIEILRGSRGAAPGQRDWREPDIFSQLLALPPALRP